MTARTRTEPAAAPAEGAAPNLTAEPTPMGTEREGGTNQPTMSTETDTPAVAPTAADPTLGGEPSKPDSPPSAEPA